MGAGDMLGALGGGLAALLGDDGTDEATAYYKQLAQKYGALDPTITAQTVGPSALETAGQDSRSAQMDVLGQLQKTYGQGGLDPISRSMLAQSTAEANRGASARENQIQEQARAQGGGRSGVTLALQQQAAQGAQGNANQQAMGAAAVAQGNRMNALNSAGNLSTGVRGQDYEAAAAQDAVSRYNSMMKMGAQQQTYGNQLAQLGGQGGAYGAAYGAQRQHDQNQRDDWAGVGQGIGGLATYLSSL